MLADYIENEYEKFKIKENEIHDLAKSIHPKLIQNLSYLDLYQDKKLTEIEYSIQYREVIEPKVRELKTYHSQIVNDIRLKIVEMFIVLGMPVGVNLETGEYIHTIHDYKNSNLCDIKFENRCFDILDAVATKFMFNTREYDPFWKRNNIYNSLCGTIPTESYNKSVDYVLFAIKKLGTVEYTTKINIGLVEKLADITKLIPYDFELDIGKAGHLTNKTNIHDILRESIRVAELTKILYLHKSKTKKD